MNGAVGYHGLNGIPMAVDSRSNTGLIHHALLPKRKCHHRCMGVTTAKAILRNAGPETLQENMLIAEKRKNLLQVDKPICGHEYLE